MTLRLFLVSVLIGSLFSCATEDYSNKPSYKIKIGETFDIFYSTNSCCKYCTPKNLNHLKITNVTTVDVGDANCEGCNYIAKYTFKGISLGKDTIELKLVGGGMSCADTLSYNIEHYPVEVTKL